MNVDLKFISTIVTYHPLKQRTSFLFLRNVPKIAKKKSNKAELRKDSTCFQTAQEQIES